MALATVGGVWVEARRAAHAPLPHFEDNDPSGTYGRRDEPVQVRVAVLGDSSVTAPGLPSGSHSWIARACDQLPWEVQLRSDARGGSRVLDVLGEQAPDAVRDGADLFVVAVGANDVLHLTPGRRFVRHLQELLDELARAAPVVTLGIGGRTVFVEDLFHPGVRGHALWGQLFAPFVHAALAEVVDGAGRGRAHTAPANG